MLKEKLSQFLYRKYSCSFSQGGEDVMLAGLFSKSKGFFVDIGAFHPVKFSNTFLLYRKGWNGINIDAAPGSMDEFKKLRPRDINIESAISDKDEELTYYYLGKGNSMNTFSKDFIDEHNFAGKVQKTINIKTQRLENILDKLAPATDIDFMSIDVEGLEINVLNSNNWDKYRPKAILLESFELMNDQNDYDLDLKGFLYKKDYKVIGKTLNSILFLRKDIALDNFLRIIP